MVGPRPACQWRGALLNPGREGQALGRFLAATPKVRPQLLQR